jgi:hypothetical protein
MGGFCAENLGSSRLKGRKEFRLALGSSKRGFVGGHGVIV